MKKTKLFAGQEIIIVEAFVVVLLIMGIVLMSSSSLAQAQSETTLSKSPSACSGDWSNCNRAFKNDASRSTASVNSTLNRTEVWNNYGFSISSNSTIISVNINADFYASNTRGFMSVRVSGDGGATYGPPHVVGGNTIEQTFVINVTDDVVWTPDKLNNSSFRVQATCFKQGSGTSSKCNLDWIPVTVVFSGDSSGGTNETTPQTIIASLVQTIDTSQFSPPSPDSAGIAYLTSSNTLLMSDSEVDEMTIWSGANLFEMTLQGSLLRTSDTISFSKEPTGVAYNPVNRHVFISDDNKRRIFEINTGADSLVGTGDDIITSFNTTSFGCDDPEGVAFGQDSVFIACGAGRKVFRVSPGFNGVFDGVSPAGDDQVSHFDTSVLGLSDPEGIEFNPDRNTLYILSRNRAMRETTLDGNLVSVIDISAANAVSPAGLAYGPGSLDPTKKSIYITARGIDNGNNPTENDGKIYEMSLS
jgi:hypothetical protein